MGIDEPYLAFCFDEACDFINNHRYFEEKKDGTLQEKWKKRPQWIDEKKEKQQNNSALIAEMQEVRKRYK